MINRKKIPAAKLNGVGDPVIITKPKSQMPRCSRCGNEGHLMTNQSCPTLVAERQQKAQRDIEAAQVARQRETKEALKEEAALIKEKLALVKEASAIVGDPTSAIAALMASNDQRMKEEVALKAEWDRKRNALIDAREAEWAPTKAAFKEKRDAIYKALNDFHAEFEKEESAFRKETDRLILEVFSEADLQAQSHRLTALAEEREHLIAFTTRTIAREEFLSPIKGLAGEKLLLRRLEAGIIAEKEVCPVFQEPLVAGDIHIAPCGHAYSKAGWEAAMKAPASRGECALCRAKPDIRRMIALNSAVGTDTRSLNFPLTARERKLAKRMAETGWGDAEVAAHDAVADQHPIHHPV